MFYARDMTTEGLPTGPDPEAITRTILETYPETDMVEALGAKFFSLDPEKHWPNYATLVTTDDFDDASNVSRPVVPSMSFVCCAYISSNPFCKFAD